MIAGWCDAFNSLFHASPRYAACPCLHKLEAFVLEVAHILPAVSVQVQRPLEIKHHRFLWSNIIIT